MTRQTLITVLMVALAVLLAIAVWLTYWTMSRTSGNDGHGLQSESRTTANTDIATNDEAVTSALTTTSPVSITLSVSNPIGHHDARVEPAELSPSSGETTVALSRFVQAVAADVDSFNPLLSANPTTQTVARLIYPSLLGQDPVSGLVTPTALATGWRIAADGMTYTFTVRSDLNWTDGAPVTSADAQFSLNAVRSSSTSSPFRSTLSLIDDVQAPNEQTLVVRLQSPDCSFLTALLRPILPAHRFASDFSDLASADQSIRPETSAGPFRFVEHRQGDSVLLTPNRDYIAGASMIDEFVLKILPDVAARRAALERGEVNLAYVNSADLRRFVAIPGATLRRYPDDGYSFVAVNLADPGAPTPGQSLDGELIGQAPHPVLGDVRIRQALAAAIDYAALSTLTPETESYRVAGYVLPSVTWAVNDQLEPVETDRELAKELLDAAGWQDEDDNGLRLRTGLPLELTLLVNDDSPQRVATANFLAEQWRSVGIFVTVAVDSFDAATEAVLEQRFDLVLLGWDNMGADPGASPFWHSRSDVPGTGYNFVSYQNAQVDALLDAARTAEGCIEEDRAALYRQIQPLVNSAYAYLFLEGRNAGWVVSDSWEGVLPGPWQIYNHVEEWRPVGLQP